VSLKKLVDVTERVTLQDIQILLRTGRLLFQLERGERSAKVRKSVVVCRTGVAVVEVEEEERLKLNKQNSTSFVVEATEIVAIEGPPEQEAIQILEEAAVVPEIHLVAKSNLQDLHKMVVPTNVTETFPEAERAPLRKMEHVGLALEMPGAEEDAVENQEVAQAVKVFVETEENNHCH